MITNPNVLVIDHEATDKESSISLTSSTSSNSSGDSKKEKNVESKPSPVSIKELRIDSKESLPEFFSEGKKEEDRLDSTINKPVLVFREIQDLEIPKQLLDNLLNKFALVRITKENLQKSIKQIESIAKAAQSLSETTLSEFLAYLLSKQTHLVGIEADQIATAIMGALKKSKILTDSNFLNALYDQLALFQLKYGANHLSTACIGYLAKEQVLTSGARGVNQNTAVALADPTVIFFLRKILRTHYQDKISEEEIDEIFRKEGYAAATKYISSIANKIHKDFRNIVPVSILTACTKKYENIKQKREFRSVEIEKNLENVKKQQDNDEIKKYEQALVQEKQNEAELNEKINNIKKLDEEIESLTKKLDENNGANKKLTDKLKSLTEKLDEQIKKLTKELDGKNEDQNKDRKKPERKIELTNELSGKNEETKKLEEEKNELTKKLDEEKEINKNLKEKITKLTNQRKDIIKEYNEKLEQVYGKFIVVPTTEGHEERFFLCDLSEYVRYLDEEFMGPKQTEEKKGHVDNYVADIKKSKPKEIQKRLFFRVRLKESMVRFLNSEHQIKFALEHLSDLKEKSNNKKYKENVERNIDEFKNYKEKESQEYSQQQISKKAKEKFKVSLDALENDIQKELAIIVNFSGSILNACKKKHTFDEFIQQCKILDLVQDSLEPEFGNKISDIFAKAQGDVTKNDVSIKKDLEMTFSAAKLDIFSVINKLKQVLVKEIKAGSSYDNFYKKNHMLLAALEGFCDSNRKISDLAKLFETNEQGSKEERVLKSKIETFVDNLFTIKKLAEVEKDCIEAVSKGLEKNFIDNNENFLKSINLIGNFLFITGIQSLFIDSKKSKNKENRSEDINKKINAVFALADQEIKDEGYFLDQASADFELIMRKLSDCISSGKTYHEFLIENRHVLNSLKLINANVENQIAELYPNKKEDSNQSDSSKGQIEEKLSNFSKPWKDYFKLKKEHMEKKSEDITQLKSKLQMALSKDREDNDGKKEDDRGDAVVSENESLLKEICNNNFNKKIDKIVQLKRAGENQIDEEISRQASSLGSFAVERLELIRKIDSLRKDEKTVLPSIAFIEAFNKLLSPLKEKAAAGRIRKEFNHPAVKNFLAQIPDILSLSNWSLGQFLTCFLKGDFTGYNDKTGTFKTIYDASKSLSQFQRLVVSGALLRGVTTIASKLPNRLLGSLAKDKLLIKTADFNVNDILNTFSSVGKLPDKELVSLIGDVANAFGGKKEFAPGFFDTLESFVENSGNKNVQRFVELTYNAENLLLPLEVFKDYVDNKATQNDQDGILKSKLEDSIAKIKELSERLRKLLDSHYFTEEYQKYLSTPDSNRFRFLILQMLPISGQFDIFSSHLLKTHQKQLTLDPAEAKELRRFLGIVMQDSAQSAAACLDALSKGEPLEALDKINSNVKEEVKEESNIFDKLSKETNKLGLYKISAPHIAKNMNHYPFLQAIMKLRPSTDRLKDDEFYYYEIEVAFGLMLTSKPVQTIAVHSGKKSIDEIGKTCKDFIKVIKEQTELKHYVSAMRLALALAIEAKLDDVVTRTLADCYSEDGKQLKAILLARKNGKTLLQLAVTTQNVAAAEHILIYYFNAELLVKEISDNFKETLALLDANNKKMIEAFLKCAPPEQTTQEIGNEIARDLIHLAIDKDFESLVPAILKNYKNYYVVDKESIKHAIDQEKYSVAAHLINLCNKPEIIYKLLVDVNFSMIDNTELDDAIKSAINRIDLFSYGISNEKWKFVILLINKCNNGSKIKQLLEKLDFSQKSNIPEDIRNQLFLALNAAAERTGLLEENKRKAERSEGSSKDTSKENSYSGNSESPRNRSYSNYFQSSDSESTFQSILLKIIKKNSQENKKESFEAATDKLFGVTENPDILCRFIKEIFNEKFQHDREKLLTYLKYLFDQDKLQTTSKAGKSILDAILDTYKESHEGKGGNYKNFAKEFKAQLIEPIVKNHFAACDEKKFVIFSYHNPGKMFDMVRILANENPEYYQKEMLQKIIQVYNAQNEKGDNSDLTYGVLTILIKPFSQQQSTDTLFNGMN